VSINNDRIIFSFDEGDDSLFKRLKIRSEYRSRTHGEELLIITDEDKPILREIWTDAIDEINNEFGSFGQLVELEGDILYELTEKQTEEGFKEAKGLLIRVILEYMLYEWYAMHGFGYTQTEIGQTQYQRYQDKLKRLFAGTTQPAAVQRPYRDYF